MTDLSKKIEPVGIHRINGHELRVVKPLAYCAGRPSHVKVATKVINTDAMAEIYHMSKRTIRRYIRDLIRRGLFVDLDKGGNEND